MCVVVLAERMIISRRFCNQEITLDNSCIILEIKFNTFINSCLKFLKSTEKQKVNLGGSGRNSLSYGFANRIRDCGQRTRR